MDRTGSKKADEETATILQNHEENRRSTACSTIFRVETSSPEEIQNAIPSMIFRKLKEASTRQKQYQVAIWSEIMQKQINNNNNYNPIGPYWWSFQMSFEWYVYLFLSINGDFCMLQVHEIALVFKHMISVRDFEPQFPNLAFFSPSFLAHQSHQDKI